MSSQDSFEYESLQDKDTIKEVLTSLLEGIESGKVVLSSNGDAIELNPSPLVKLAVRAKKKGQTGKINLKFSWKEQKNFNVSSKGDLTISV